MWAITEVFNFFYKIKYLYLFCINNKNNKKVRENEGLFKNDLFWKVYHGEQTTRVLKEKWLSLDNFKYRK